MAKQQTTSTQHESASGNVQRKQVESKSPTSTVELVEPHKNNASARTTRKKTTTVNQKIDKKLSLLQHMPTPSLPTVSENQFGRVVILNVKPSAEQSVFNPRVSLGEVFKVSAQAFMEGRSTIGVTAVLRNPRGKITQQRNMQCINAGLDQYECFMQAGTISYTKPWESDFVEVKKQLKTWTVTIEAWEDTYAEWLHDTTIKVSVQDDTANAFAEGSALFERWSTSKNSELKAAERKYLYSVSQQLLNEELSYEDRLRIAQDPHVTLLHNQYPLRDALSTSRAHNIVVERPTASFAAWYQFFPRSEGAYFDKDTKKIVSGNLQTSVSALERAAAGGFDVVYLPPIFPIGHTNRKGKNNSLLANDNDPGSPFGIGSELGGHDTIHPELGTMDDFRQFTKRAHELGLEVALDFALQCSPDHPWVKQHPQWFKHKPDGTIAFAENPPKKYQDIYPIDFNADIVGIEREVVRILELWINAGVTIFRVDNPHTKPVRFWQDVIEIITKKHPEVLFLAEAFTRPGMVRALSYVGFTQSHCYFPWRNTKEELESYLEETNSEQGYWQHNTFWPSTPDILTDYLVQNGVAGHAVRAVLAAMGSPSWGIYNGYELIENAQRPGVEEHINNEKYEIVIRDWNAAESKGISLLLSALNTIRHNHISTHSYHTLQIIPTSNPSILAFARHTPSYITGTPYGDTLITIVNLDGHNAQQAWIHLDLPKLELPTNRPIVMHDELTGRNFEWSYDNFVSLAPWADVAHILTPQY